MLKLRRLELVGFKSFHDRSEISVSDSGVTAVVGPNGCGKSNISDAVAWVLGEQRARSLRGDRMEDVIFSGTGKRSALGMAEVSMSLIDDAPNHANGNGSGNGGPPQGPVEVMVQRRLFRSGESQYLLNGRPCRLRDIQDIFLGTGLGPNSYAIIEQGRIGQILSARPADRRTLVEEAAGVTRFKAKRKLAESRLQAAQKNLARVSDILQEVERQRNSLKRQASKARRYREVRHRLREVLAAVFSTRAEVLIQAQEQIARDLEAMAEEGQTLEQDIATLNARVHGARLELEAREKAIEDARKRQVTAKLDLEKAEQSIERQQDRVRSLEARKADLTTDLERIVSELEARVAAMDAATRQLSELDLGVTTLTDRIDQEERQLADLGRQRQAEEQALEVARNRRFDVVGRKAQLTNEISGKEELLERVGRHLDRTRVERDEAREATGLAQERLDSIHAERLAVETEIERLNNESAENQQNVDTARAAHSAAVEAVSTVRAHQEAIRHRLATIKELSLERAYGTESLQDFFNSIREEAWSPLGIVADFIDVEPEYEAVVEDLLHTELQYIVVEDLLQAGHALSRVRETNRGHLDFFVLDSEADGSVVPEPVPGARPIADLVRLDPRLRSFGAVIRGAYLVDDFRHAWDLSQTQPGKTFVARTGEVVRDRVVSWGERSSHGPLSLKREMRELDRKGEEARRQVEEAEERQTVARASLDELVAIGNQLSEQLRSAETEVLGLDHRLSTSKVELERAEQRFRVSEGELARLDEESGGLERGIAVARKDVDEIQQALVAIDEELRVRAESSLRLSESAERDAVAIGELRSRLAVLGERREAAGREIRTLGEQADSLSERRAWTEEQIGASLAQKTEALESITADRQRRDTLSSETGELEEQIRADASKLDSFRDELRGTEAEWDSARAALDGWKDRHNTAEIKRNEIESDLRHLVSMCQSELGDTIESVCLDTFETLGAEQLAAHEDEHRLLRERLESMGNVNMMAVEEYEEAVQRFEFLSTQRTDLLDSIRDTTQAIGEIDTVCARQFADAFREINDRFKQAFLDLFGGGRGELRLIDESDNADAGIEIVAQPPGKKLQNVLLLSGGEKALTALALVIALFRFRPSPFCVLDEVDAPLDDANVDRFANLIRLMSEETQFLVITHSKRTMETAKQLYGVTMEEPGVSKVVSVRLN